jgi:nitroreductase
MTNSPINDHAVTDVLEAARTRRSVRAYRTEPVPMETLREIITTAGQAPSGTNIQPWRVHVLTGRTLEKVGTAIRTAYLQGETHPRDYEYYTEPMFEPFLARRRACGWGLYGTLGIGRGDREKSEAYRIRNFTFFDAPVGMVFTIHRELKIGSWLDYGMFLQTIMLAARARGLHTCAQASIASYPDVVRRELAIDSVWTVVAGMALGYADTSDVVNTFQPERLPLDDYATFLD